MEQLNFNMLFRWFVGLGLDDGVWDASAFCHNRDRLLEAAVSAQLLAGVIQHHKVRGLLSRDRSRLGVDESKGEDDGDGGSGRTPSGIFKKRSNATHASTTDPDARLKGNGRESKLCYMGHALGRHGLATIASGTAEREAALDHRQAARWRVEAAGVGSRWAGMTRGFCRAAAAPPCRTGPRHQDRQAAQDQDRRAHDAPSRLRRHSASVEDFGQDERARPNSDRVTLRSPGLGRLQPRPTTQTAGGANMTGDAGTPLAKWQICLGSARSVSP